MLVPLPSIADPVGEAWRSATIQSGPSARDEPPHPEALHEWWYFTVQNPAGGGGCGPWQAMVAFRAGREAATDKLLMTTVVDRAGADHTLDFAPGSLRRGWNHPSQN